MFCFINVSAKNYYTDYGKFSKWDTTYIEATDTIYVEEKKLYKYYHEDIAGDYYIKGTNPSDHIIDETKYKYGNYSNYTYDIPELIEGRIVESVPIYEYQSILPIKYISFHSFYGTGGKLTISEIKIYDKSNHQISYDAMCDYCSTEFLAHLNNGVITDKYSINKDALLTLILNEEHYYDDLVIKVYLYDPTDVNKTFFITASDIRMLDYTLSNTFLDYFKSIDDNDIKEYTFDYQNMNYKPLWSKPTISYDRVTENKYTKVNKSYLYRYKDLYYYYYMVTKTYSDYLEKPTKYYNKQSDEYITYYRYKVREKVDYDGLNKEYTNLLKNYDKLVSSNDELNLRNDVLNKDIEKLNLINKNTLEELEGSRSTYNEMIESINNERIENNNLKMEVESLENSLSIKDEEKNRLTKEFENEIFNLKMSDEKEVSQVRTIPLLKIGDNYIYILPIIFLIVILLLLYILKKKKKN